MTHKAINWFENQMIKLEASDFDFEVWETSTCLMFDTLFGKENPFTQRLLNLDNTFNSWSLRDAVGNQSYEERNRKMAAEILQSAIDRLRIDENSSIDMKSNSIVDELLAIVYDELTGNQVRTLKGLLLADHSSDEKKRQLADIFREDGISERILVRLMLVPSVITTIDEKR